MFRPYLKRGFFKLKIKWLEAALNGQIVDKEIDVDHGQPLMLVLNKQVLL